MNPYTPTTTQPYKVRHKIDWVETTLMGLFYASFIISALSVNYAMYRSSQRRSKPLEGTMCREVPILRTGTARLQPNDRFQVDSLPTGSHPPGEG